MIVSIQCIGNQGTTAKNKIHRFTKFISDKLMLFDLSITMPKVNAHTIFIENSFRHVALASIYGDKQIMININLISLPIYFLRKL